MACRIGIILSVKCFKEKNMRLIDIINPLNVAQKEAISPLKPAQNQNDSASKACSWGIGGGAASGADSVKNFARSLCPPGSSQKRTRRACTLAEEANPLLEFKAYMKEARGEVTTSGKEYMMKRLKALEDKIAKISKDENMAEEAKTSTIKITARANSTLNGRNGKSGIKLMQSSSAFI